MFFLHLCSLPFHYIWNVDPPPHGVMMSCTKITGSPSDVSEGDTDLKERSHSGFAFNGISHLHPFFLFFSLSFLVGEIHTEVAAGSFSPMA